MDSLTRLKRVLDVAQRNEIGRDMHREVGRELHEQIDPHEWCGGWVRMILKRVGLSTPGSWDRVDNIRAAATSVGVYHRGLQGVQAGDILIHGIGGGAHVGFALGPYRNGVVHSIAGNSSGGVVAERYIGETGAWHWDGYVRMEPLLSGRISWDGLLESAVSDMEVDLGDVFGDWHGGDGSGHHGGGTL